MQTALADATAPTLQRALESDAGVRWMPAANFHLTLVFLGSVPRSRLPAVEEAAASCVQSSASPSVEVVLDGIEYWRRSQLLCVTASATPPAVTRLAASLSQALTARSFTPDLKEGLRAHVTIARKIRRPIQIPQIKPQAWLFRSFALVESKTKPEGSAYTVIASYPLSPG